MLIVFFDAKGIVHHEYVHPGQTVTGKFYVQVLQRPNARVNRVRPEIKNSWRLHHDNAPAHTAAVTAAILTKLGVCQSSHSQPTAPTWPPQTFFFYFPA